MKKIKIVSSLIVFSLVLLASTASAQMGMMGNYWDSSNAFAPAESAQVKSALQEIYKSQNVEGRAQVDCSKVTDDQFEKLGDAYMGLMLPNESQHEVMDNMMGGEGSASLRQAHITMGRSYLGCWSNYNSGPVFMPMMGGITGGYNNYGFPMTWGDYGIGGMFFMVAWSALAIVGIFTLIKWLISVSSSKK